MVICFLCDAPIDDEDARIGLRNRTLYPACYQDYGDAIEPADEGEQGLEITCPRCGLAGDNGAFNLRADDAGEVYLAACPTCRRVFTVGFVVEEDYAGDDRP